MKERKKLEKSMQGEKKRNREKTVKAEKTIIFNSGFFGFVDKLFNVYNKNKRVKEKLC